jgi:putative redox protein
MATFEVTFPGGVAVDATFNGHHIHTDQPAPLGGDTAPSPFDLFLGSLATCAGFYALRFCQERQIATSGLRVTLRSERDSATKRLSDVRISVELPDEFPEKYREAIHRVIDQCAVKKAVLDPPAFTVEVTAPSLAQ